MTDDEVEWNEEPKTNLPRDEIYRQIVATLEKLRDESLILYHRYNRDLKFLKLDQYFDFELEDVLTDLKITEEQLHQIAEESQNGDII